MSLSANSVIRILLIDSHTLVRTSLRAFLNSQPGMRVVGETGNPADGLALAEEHQPDIILFEPHLANPASLNIIPQLLSATERGKVILVTGISDEAFSTRAARLGAMGVVLKDQGADVLLKAITKVHSGEAWLTRSTIATLVNELGRKRPDESKSSHIASLSQREKDIILLLGEGLKNSQIAERLLISEVTVRHYVAGILQKLCLDDRVDLLVYAYRNGLAQVPR